MKIRSIFRAVRRRRMRMRGMSLIETMVGMTLGILVSLIITQVWGVFENQKQRTVSATAGQATGLLALTELEQDVRSAGAGLTDSAMFNCGTIFSYYENGGTKISPVPAYAGSMGLAPVQIIDGGAGSDTVIVKRSSDFLGSIPATVQKMESPPGTPSPSADIEVSNTSGFAAGDVVLLVGATGNCTVTQVTEAVVAPPTLRHASGAITYNPTAAFKSSPTALPLPPPPAVAPVLTPWPSYVPGDKVVKIGQMFSRSYTVNANNELTVRDDSVPTTSTTSSLASDIVMVKAQYGIANTGSQNVLPNDWFSATAASGWNVLNPAQLKRIKAVRVVIVARSAKMEAPGTTTVAPVAWPDVKSPVIDLSANPDWTRYRYRTYQLVIPIRNVIWANV